jgi:osmotically-inducible protein OsmY
MVQSAVRPPFLSMESLPLNEPTAYRSRVAQRIAVSLVAAAWRYSCTRRRIRATAADAVTADQQQNNKSDLETSRQIRRAIMADKSLSTYAHNIKIVTQQGKVTLRGPVRTEAEKEVVQAKAIEVAGAANVTSAVTVAPAKSRKPKTS